jgi:hypothetical protein
MGILRKDDEVIICSGFFDFLRHIADNGCSFRGTQSTVDKIILHIDNNQKFFLVHFFLVLSKIVSHNWHRRKRQQHFYDSTGTRRPASCHFMNIRQYLLNSFLNISPKPGHGNLKVQ